ncbi:hypothetical protein [Mucilaginibacter sp.]|uniref:hypothetical protein n=1 Tax=Mucilaginibacter sp. TaxID=1882438 RepID=UPI00260B505F|nr:hypothetical protein [Mucilaginibacter sp.]MDB5032681.1 hypothetical protein [Mucilaginibacter sp.]
MSNISLLLGAGFSVNKGYPTANQLNNKITSLRGDEFTVAQQGSVCWLKKGQVDPYIHDASHTYKLFTLELIAFYVANHESFNYEEFFDYYTNVNQPGQTDEAFEQLCNAFREKHNIENENIDLIGRHNSIFNQLISGFLVDRDGTKFYEKIHHMGPYAGYNGFLGCLQKWGNENIVHINTLNHDLFLESLNHTDALHGNLSDGFQELGSPFYGGMEDGSKIRLSYFSCEYDTNFRLYKLHGSLDQYPFHLMNGGKIDSYIKIKPGIGVTDLYKEVTDEDGKLAYINDFINYFPDFLSGTTSKILRYSDLIYYEGIFKAFESNLQASDTLILIGYGCGDQEINNIILENFKGRIYVVDPFPQPATFEFCEKAKAVLVQKTPEQIGLDDFKK